MTLIIKDSVVAVIVRCPAVREVNVEGGVCMTLGPRRVGRGDWGRCEERSSPGKTKIGAEAGIRTGYKGLWNE